MPDNIFELTEVDALFRLEANEFTKERNRIAKRFKDEGDKRLADQITALRKPTKVAWAMNQVVYDEDYDVDQLIDAATRLRVAQRALVERGNQDNFREIQRAFRDAISVLKSHVTAKAGVASGVEVAARIEQAAWDENALTQLLSGHLSSLDDVELGSGFELFAGITPQPKTDNEDAKRNEQRERLERDVKLAEGDVERARKDLALAQERLAHAQTSLAHAQRKLDESQ